MTVRLAELVGALMLLTRLPVARWARANPAPAACVWAYPLVGALVGGIGAVVLLLALALHLPPTVAAFAGLAATILLTGALHEDGLADTVDGFGGGSTVARKLEIMRDSRIGSYGALALALSVSLRVAALAASAHPALALLLAAVLGRGAMIVLLAQLRPVRADGLAATLADTGLPRMIVGLGAAAAATLLAPITLPVAALAAFGMLWLARRQLGGYTGDVLGAAEQAVECAVLTAMAAA